MCIQVVADGLAPVRLSLFCPPTDYLESPMRPLPISVLAMALTVSMTPALASKTMPLPDSPALEQHVDQLLSKLTLDQKLKVIGGQDLFYTHALPSIGLPALKTANGNDGIQP